MNKKTWLIIGLTVLAVIAIFCVIVCIACACNGLTFGQQIVQWFTAKPKVLPEGDTENIVEAAFKLFR